MLLNNHFKTIYETNKDIQNNIEIEK